MKSIAILAICCVLVNGRSLERSHSRRDFQQMLLGSQNPQIDAFPPDSFEARVGEIQNALKLLYKYLDTFKGNGGYGGQQTGGLNDAIANLDYEIQTLNAALTEAANSSLRNSTMELAFKLYQLYGDKFLDALDLSYDDTEEQPITAEEYETTGDGYFPPSPPSQLSDMSNKVKSMIELVRMKAADDENLNKFVLSIIKALSATTGETGHSSTTSGFTTSNPPTEAPTESQTTTEGQTTTTESTEGQNPTTESTETQGTTTEGQGTTTTTAGQGTTTTAEGQGTTTTTEGQGTTTKTEGPAARRESILRRRLAELLLKKLMKTKEE